MIIIQILHHFLLKMNNLIKISLLFLLFSPIAIFCEEITIDNYDNVYDLRKGDWYITESNPIENQEKIQWEKIQVPSNANEKFKNKEVWYKIIVKCKLPVKESIGIKLGIISDRDKVYWNGTLIGSRGIWNSPHPI